MGSRFSGRNAYVYVAGNAVVNLKGWNTTFNNSVVQLDPDIGSNWNESDDGFKSASGSIDFNLSTDDYNDLFDALTAGAAVSLYQYTKTATGVYLYGQARLASLNTTSQVGQTVAGSISWNSTGQWGRGVTA